MERGARTVVDLLLDINPSDGGSYSFKECSRDRKIVGAAVALLNFALDG